MSIFSTIQLRIDQKFRKPKYAKILLEGIKSHMLASFSYVKAHIRNREDEMETEKAAWQERIQKINENYKKLNSYGYKNRKEYFSDQHSALDSDLLDIIGTINRLEITSEDQELYNSTITEHLEEIEAAEKVLASLEKMSPIISSAKVQSIEEIDKLFEDNGCTYLLYMPSVIDVSKILIGHYYK